MEGLQIGFGSDPPLLITALLVMLFAVFCLARTQKQLSEDKQRGQNQDEEPLLSEIVLREGEEEEEEESNQFQGQHNK